MAACVDGVVAALLVLACYGALAFGRFLLSPRTFELPVVPAYARLGAVLAVSVLYLAACWTVTGSTAGGRLLGLSVRMRGGGHGGLPRSLARAALCVLFPLGLLWCVVDPRSRSVQDLVLGTEVVYEWHPHPAGK